MMLKCPKTAKIKSTNVILRLNVFMPHKVHPFFVFLAFFRG
jgi:hypothetical protein